MTHNSLTNTSQRIVVMSTVDKWSSLVCLLQECCKDKCHQLTFSSQGSNQVYDLMLEGCLISFNYVDLKEDMTEESISQAMDVCYTSCADGIRSFLLLIQGGQYTKWERRTVDILQAYFGAAALTYLVILSLDNGKVVEMLDDNLLELINICDGRYCQIKSPESGEELSVLLVTVDYMLTENGASGYTDDMLAAAKARSTEDSAMKMLKMKVQEAQKKEQDFRLLVHQQEERRAREMEEVKQRHADERRKEAAEQNQFKTKRESLEEAVISHKSMLQLQTSADPDDETKKTSVILLGLSGSGKSSALNLILERAGNRYPPSDSCHEPPQPTLTCERKEVFAAGRRLILVDTPELWDEDGVENLELVKDCLALSLPGPHVFLLVLQVGRFTQGECEMLSHLQKIFGRDFAEHAIVLLVHFNSKQHRSQRIHDHVSGAHESLREFIRKCGSRYYELDVCKSQSALSYPQVKDLLAGVNKLVASHGGRCHSGKRFNVQELQGRKKVIEEMKNGEKEGNHLLRDA